MNEALLAALKEAVMTGEREAFAALLDGAAALDASLSEVVVHAQGREDAASELARLWRGPGTHVDWSEAVYDDGAAVTVERLGRDGALRRVRLYLHAADGRADHLHAYEARPRPEAAATPAGVPAEVLARLAPGAVRAPLVNAGNSGGTLDRVVLGDGRVLVAKRVLPGGDWIGRATHDPGREALLARCAGFPPSVDPGVVAVEEDPRGGWWVLMRDLGAELLPEGATLTADDARQLLRAAADLHEAFRGAPPDAGLCSLEDRLRLHSPAVAAAERGHPDLVPKQLEAGWAAFAQAAPRDVAEAVLALVDDPSGLAAATLAAAPATLVHGDFRDDNLGLRADGGIVLIDWGLAAAAPAPVDFAWFLLHVGWRFAPALSRDDLVAAFVAAEGGDGLELALLGGLVMYGWLLGHSAVVHPDARERAWARDELAWWSERARAGLERL
jgi:aminoglycoside phosphotransferase (APT) family kinase protein